MVRRVSAQLLALTLIASGVAAYAQPYPAAAASQVSCTKLTLTSTTRTDKDGTSKFKLSGCTPVSATGGSAIMVLHAVFFPYKASDKITWAAKKGTTSNRFAGKVLVGDSGKCPPHYLRLLDTLTTTGGTGAAGRAIPKGSVGKMSVCGLDARVPKVMLEPGTKATF